MSFAALNETLMNIRKIQTKLGPPSKIGLSKTYDGIQYISVRNMGELYWERADRLKDRVKKRKVKKHTKRSKK